MLKIDAGRAGNYCYGINRRNFVQVGLSGVAAIGLPEILQAKAAAASTSGQGKNTAIILMWLDGGPGHIDLYDMKPEAPAEYRGIWRPVPTNVPGIEINPLLARQTKIADKFSIIRSLQHHRGDHFTAGHYMLTGRGGVSGADTPQKAPFVGSFATKVTGPRKPGMPAYASVPYAASIGLRPGYFGANFLGPSHNPFEIGGDPNSKKFKVRNMELGKSMSLHRLEDRHTLVQSLDRMRRDLDSSGTSAAMNEFDQQAFELVTGAAARKAFDISRENDRTRDRYGRHSIGQSTLLARRLVQAGCTLVTVHSGGWDDHWNLQKGMEKKLPPVDQAFSALVEDLHQTGLIERVMVMLCGEFGRTPRMNDGGNGGPPLSKGTPGRDHWGNAMFCLVAGAGIQGGKIIGSTNRLGEVPKDRPLTPSDLHHTMFHILGVDRDVEFVNHSGRPVAALEPGNVIRELF